MVGTGPFKTETVPGPACPFRCDFCQPDVRFHSLYLAEKRPDTPKGMIPPILKQSGRLGCHQPLCGFGQLTPSVHILPDLVEDGVGVIDLLSGGYIVEQEGRFLFYTTPAFGGFGNRCHIVGSWSSLPDTVVRLGSQSTLLEATIVRMWVWLGEG